MTPHKSYFQRHVAESPRPRRMPLFLSPTSLHNYSHSASADDQFDEGLVFQKHPQRKMNPLIAFFWMCLNIAGNSYKKLRYVKK